MEGGIEVECTHYRVHMRGKTPLAGARLQLRARKQRVRARPERIVYLDHPA